MGSPIGEAYPAWLKRWRENGTKPRDARYYHQLYVARPAWADLQKIKDTYKECRQRKLAGEDVVVDHIIPMNSLYVCGLMCEHNLQIITYAENEHKSNTSWPDMWAEQLHLPL